MRRADRIAFFESLLDTFLSRAKEKASRRIPCLSDHAAGVVLASAAGSAASRWSRDSMDPRNFGLQTFTTEDVRAYIDMVRWQFAKTMPHWPHEYTVRRWTPEFDREFEAFVQLIRNTGVVKPWPRTPPTPKYHHTYLSVGLWEYWTMGEPVAETTVINRARLEGPQ